MTDCGLKVKAESPVYELLSIHSCSPGTTPDACELLVVARMWNVLPALTDRRNMPPKPSPVSLIHTAMSLLWQ